MKTYDVLKTTANSKEYKRLKGNVVTKCSRCSPNKGCNKWGKSRAFRNWKSNRKTQWKMSG